MVARAISIQGQETSAQSGSISLSRRTRLLPIVVVLAYLCFTVFLFAFGPWEYPMREPERLYGFLGLAHLALLLGYLSAAFRRPAEYRGRWSVERLVWLSAALNLAILYPTAVFRTGGSLDVLAGLAAPGDAYAASQEARELGTPLVEYVRIGLGPVLSLMLPLCIFYWRRLSVGVRLASTLAMLGTVALFVAMGTNKAIADTVLIFPWMIVAAHVSGVGRVTRRAAIVLAAVSIISFALGTLFFASTQSTRAGSSASAGYSLGTGTRADFDNVMVAGLPPAIQVGVLGANMYLSHGYYALYLSLREPFVPMFGVGHSMFLYRQAARLLDDPHVLRMPYPVRIEKYGWDSYGLWSSIYPWLASDVSFPGTIVLIFLVGRLFAFCWLDTLRGSNPLAVALLAQVVVMLFYFPANNQLLQTGEGLTSFWGIFGAWLMTRGRLSRGGGQC